jgi:hypothetical protein
MDPAFFCRRSQVPIFDMPGPAPIIRGRIRQDGTIEVRRHPWKKFPGLEGHRECAADPVQLHGGRIATSRDGQTF